MSSGGMGIVYTICTQLFKEIVGWDGREAMILSAVVALLFGTGAFFAVRYQWYQYIEDFWPVLLAWGTMVVGGWGISQWLYKKAPRRNGS